MLYLGYAAVSTGGALSVGCAKVSGTLGGWFIEASVLLR